MNPSYRKNNFTILLIQEDIVDNFVSILNLSIEFKSIFFECFIDGDEIFFDFLSK